MSSETIYAEIYSELYLNRQNYNLEKFAKMNLLPSSNILDVGCGIGHQIDQLAKLGFFVTGLEPSLEMYSLAKQTQKNNDIRIHNCDLVEFRCDSKFDLIISMFNVFNYFLELNYLETCVRRISDLVNSGGKILIEMWNGEIAINNPPKTTKKIISTNRFGNLEYSIYPEKIEKDLYSLNYCFKSIEYNTNSNPMLDVRIMHKLWQVEKVKEIFSAYGLDYVGIADQLDYKFTNKSTAWKVAILFEKGKES